MVAYFGPQTITGSYTGPGLPVTTANTAGGVAPWYPIAPTGPAPVAPTATPVVPQIDPNELANATYGKRMPLFAGGLARIGGAICVGPWIDGGRGSFGISFGVPANVDGTRILYDIALDSKIAWRAANGATSSAGGSFVSESFVFRFYQGRLDQAVDALESAKYPTSAIAYRPQMMLFFESLPLAAFGDKIPYVSALIGDNTDGADPTEGLNLGEAMERIAYSPWARYDSGTFVSESITDVVPAILLKDNFTIVELCQNITSVYKNLDLVQSDKLRLKDHGSLVSPDLIVTLDNVISDDRPVQYSRIDPASVAREVELVTVDADADYTTVSSLSQRPRDPVTVSASVGHETVSLPVVMDAATRQAMVSFKQYYEETARKKVSLVVPAYGMNLEPGDRIGLVGMADGIPDEVFKVVETLHGANYVVEIQAESILRCAFGANGPGWDPDHKNSGVALSENNTVATSSGDNQVAVAVPPLLQDSYWEVRVGAEGIGNVLLGVAFQPVYLSRAVISTVAGFAYNSNGSLSAPLNVAFTTGDVIGIAFRPSTGELWFSKNGVWLGSDPTGTAATTISHAGGRVFYPAVSFTGPGGGSVTINCLPSDFVYDQPLGFFGLSQQGRPEFQWNPSDIGSNLVLSENNTKVAKSSTGVSNVRLGIEAVSGKQVWAVKLTADGPGTNAKAVGLAHATVSLSALLGSNSSGIGYRATGGVVQNGSTLQTYTGWGLAGDIVMIATDNDARKVWFGLNGVWNGDPGAGTGDIGAWPDDGSDEEYAFIACGMTDANDTFKLIDFPYGEIPSGFTAPPVA